MEGGTVSVGAIVTRLPRYGQSRVVEMATGVCGVPSFMRSACRYVAVTSTIVTSTRYQDLVMCWSKLVRAQGN